MTTMMQDFDGGVVGYKAAEKIIERVYRPSTLAALDRQMAIVVVMAEFHMRTGIFPTIRAISDGTGIPSTSVVNYHLERLIARGLVAKTSKISRGHVLTEAGFEMAADLGVVCAVQLCPHCHQDINKPSVDRDPDLLEREVQAVVDVVDAGKKKKTKKKGGYARPEISGDRSGLPMAG